MVHVGLCEDDPAIRRVVSDALALTGHSVLAAHNGGEALRMFAADDSLEVIVLDIGLPDSDGRDVCQALRSAGQTAPVIFLTALGAMHEKLAGFSAGADDYLAKPYRLRELYARISALVRRGPAQTALKPETSAVHRFGPFTLETASSTSRHRSSFFTGFLSAVFQPLRFQFSIQPVTPPRTYCESV